MAWKPVRNPTREEEASFRREFAKKARFLVDQNMPAELTEVLRARGWNIKTAKDLRLEGKSDEDVFAAAWREDRILVTHDRDFLDERRFPPHRNPGVVVLPGGSGNIRHMVRALAAVLPIVGDYRELWRGACFDVTGDGIVSIRNLDRKSGTRTTSRFRYGSKSAEEWME